MTMHQCDCGQLLWLVSDVKCHDCGKVHSFSSTKTITSKAAGSVAHTTSALPSTNGLQGLLDGLLPLAIHFKAN